MGVNRCWPRRQTANPPPQASSALSDLTDGLFFSATPLQICPIPKGIWGTLGVHVIGGGVQKLDTKGVPAASDRVKAGGTPEEAKVQGR